MEIDNGVCFHANLACKNKNIKLYFITIVQKYFATLRVYTKTRVDP